MTSDDRSNIARKGESSPVIKPQTFERPDAARQHSRSDGAERPTETPFDTPVRPATVTAATAAYTAARAGGKRPWWHSQFNLMLAVFGLLAASAFLFVMLAPPPQLESVPNSVTPQSTAATNEVAPWSQSQLAEARTQSQAILANLLASKKALEEKDVMNWAPDQFDEALNLAAQGDEAYKQQDYAVAIARYESAVNQMDSLFDLLPQLVQTKLEEGRAALKEGKSALAKELFGKANQLDENNLDAAAGLDLAKQLDDALDLMATAQQNEADYEQSGDIEDLLSAEKMLQEAVDLFNGYPRFSENLQRVQNEITDKRFKVAMTKAYQALFANRYQRARSAFAEALQIKPGDPAAARALQQALASDQTSSISSLLANAKQYEQREEWASAKSNYQTVLQRDANQVSAKLGNIRSGARLTLDQQLEDVLSDKLALSRSGPRAKAEKVLKDARAIPNKGSRLKRQIAQLESAVNQLDTVVKVSFRSDSLTKVTLQKVGSKAIQLGTFSVKNLSLKPGRYVAVGVRLGYQDVRKEIELLPSGDDLQIFDVRCEQALSTAIGG